MVVLEDKDLEQFVFDTKADVMVPIEIFKGEDGSSVITVYSACRYIADELDERFGTDPMSETAVAWIEDAMRKITALWGYEFDPYYRDPICEFVLDDKSKLNLAAKNEHTRIFTNAEDAGGLAKLTLHGIECEADREDDGTATVVIDGKIVACASVNDYWDSGDRAEINVETAVGYRGRGYGTSAVVALCEFLMGFGYGVSYKCREANSASVKIAEKAGFRRAGKRLSFVCYRKDNIDGI